MKKIVSIIIAVGIVFIACSCSNDTPLDEVPFYLGESYEDAYEDMKEITDDVYKDDETIEGKDVTLFGSEVNPCSVILNVKEGDSNGVTWISLGFNYGLDEDPDYKESFQQDYEVILDKLKDEYGEPTNESTTESTMVKETKWDNGDAEIILEVEEMDMQHAFNWVGMYMNVQISKVEENIE